jgi:uncharacterized protein DUF5667
MSDRFPEPRMRDEFRSELRAKLIAEAQTVLDPHARRGTAWTSWLRPALGVGVAALVLIAGAGTAAASSLPGDPAFALKKAVEDLQVTLTFDDVQRVQLLAQLADRRLDELQKVANSADKAPTASEEYAEAVTRFRAAVDAMQRAAPQDKADAAQGVADAARDKHDAVLDVIEDKVPEQAKPALERAKEEEHRDRNDNDSSGTKGKDTPRPNRSAEPTRTPRPTETSRATESPRRTDAPATTRPATPRPSPSNHD